MRPASGRVMVIFLGRIVSSWRRQVIRTEFFLVKSLACGADTEQADYL